MYKADRRYYLNSRGQAVEEGDPDAQSLLVAEGQSLSAADARKYGLVADEPQAEADAPATGARLSPPRRTQRRTARRMGRSEAER
jgi:enoyl-CoA hydratase/carnithine racemase